jgi:hypothetical protein
MSPSHARRRPAARPRPKGWRVLVAALATVYLLAIALDAAGSGWPARFLPLPLRFFVQVAELFPHASRDAVEWRAEAWRCDDGTVSELDVRPFFPIRPDDKESRFYRAMFFYHRQPRVLRALEQFIIREQNRRHPEQRIGGVTFLSLLIPIPAPGTALQPYRRQPIADYPATVIRNRWYAPDPELCRRRCRGEASR